MDEKFFDKGFWLWNQCNTYIATTRLEPEQNHAVSSFVAELPRSAGKETSLSGYFSEERQALDTTWKLRESRSWNVQRVTEWWRLSLALSGEIATHYVRMSLDYTECIPGNIGLQLKLYPMCVLFSSDFFFFSSPPSVFHKSHVAQVNVSHVLMCMPVWILWEDHFTVATGVVSLEGIFFFMLARNSLFGRDIVPWEVF